MSLLITDTIQCIEKLTKYLRAFTKCLHVSVHGNVTKLMRCFYLVNKADYTVYPVWVHF